jgi:hypothetical protein
MALALEKIIMTPMATPAECGWTNDTFCNIFVYAQINRNRDPMTAVTQQEFGKNDNH